MVTAEKPIFKREFTLKWRDLFHIRSELLVTLYRKMYSRTTCDSIIIIVSEILEDIFKLCDRKLAAIILREHPEGIIVKIHHPVVDFQSKPLKQMLSTIKQVNEPPDINRLYMETLLAESREQGNKFRYARIRKIAGGQCLEVKRSRLYQPGLSLAILYKISKRAL